MGHKGTHRGRPTVHLGEKATGNIDFIIWSIYTNFSKLPTLLLNLLFYASILPKSATLPCPIILKTPISAFHTFTNQFRNSTASSESTPYTYKGRLGSISLTGIDTALESLLISPATAAIIASSAKLALAKATAKSISIFWLPSGVCDATLSGGLICARLVKRKRSAHARGSIPRARNWAGVIKPMTGSSRIALPVQSRPGS